MNKSFKTATLATVVVAAVALMAHQTESRLFATEANGTTAVAVQDTWIVNSSNTSYNYPTRNNTQTTLARAVVTPATVIAPVAVVAPVNTTDAPSATAAARYIIPSGTIVNAKIVTAVSTRTAKVGDPVEAVTTEAVRIRDNAVIPAGSTVTGRVTSVRPASETKAAADLEVVFTSINGHATRLALATPDLDARAKTANHAVDAGLVGAGAVLGGIIGHQISHKNGTVVGAIGGGVIGGVAAANIGANVQLKAGEPATLRFEQDLTIL